MNVSTIFYALLMVGLILLKVAGTIALSWWWIVAIGVGLPILWVVVLWVIFLAALQDAF